MCEMIASIAVGIIVVLYVLQRRVTPSIPVLMYHRIANISGDRITVDPEMFEKQMKYLSRKGYHSISMADLYAHLTHGNVLPKKPILLTFDDGYEDNYTNALPILKKYGMKGIIFIIAGWQGKNNDWENYPGKPSCRTMDAETLKKWLASGMEVGSHTVNHLSLSSVNDEEVIRMELTESKKTLETQLGIAIDFVCYPYGDFNNRVEKIVHQAGYKGALAILNEVPLFEINIFAIPRIAISNYHSIAQFKLKVSAFHKTLRFIEVIERKSRHFLKAQRKTKKLDK